MTDYILLDGDIANFNPTFGMAMVVVQPGSLAGSGDGIVAGKAMCVEGDEAKVSVLGCSYVAGAFTVPGTGTVKIDALGSDLKSVVRRCYSRARCLPPNLRCSLLLSSLQRPQWPTPRLNIQVEQVVS